MVRTHLLELKMGVLYLNIPYAPPEVAPFATAGGLTDVAGSLPQAVERSEEDDRIIMPLYGYIEEKRQRRMVYCRHAYVYQWNRKQSCGLLSHDKGCILGGAFCQYENMC